MARRAADKLREIILSKPVGTYLGSQEDLLQLLGIGKVTLHQTARLLEHEALLEVRRGLHGGYFRSRPDIGLVARAADIYLHAKAVKLSDHQAVTRAISTELMRQAVHSKNDAAWKKLEALESRVANAGNLDDSLLDFDSISEFFDILFELADNPLGEMIIRVNARLVSYRPIADLATDEDAKWRYHKIRLQMVRALLDRDGDYAALLVQRFSVFMDEQIEKAKPMRRGNMQ